MHHYKVERDIGIKAVEEILNRYGGMSWELVHISRNPELPEAYCLILRRERHEVLEYLEGLRKEKEESEQEKSNGEGEEKNTTGRSGRKKPTKKRKTIKR